MLLGNDLLELIGTLDDPETGPRVEDTDDPDDATPSAGTAAPPAR